MLNVRPAVGLGMAVVLLAWLLPNHSPPWPSFYNEVWMAIALLPVAVWLLLRSAQPVRLPAAAMVVATFAVVPLLQSAAGQIHYRGDALLATIYLLGLALCIVMGARWRDVASGEGTHCVFTTLLLAALLSTHLALLQWLRIDGLGVLLADLPIGGRPNANVAQANHLASLLFLGLVSIWGLYLRGDVRGGVAWLAAAYLLFGMAMTQSRTGWLEVALLAGAAVTWPQRLRSRHSWIGLLGLLAFFVSLVVLWPSINQVLLLDGGLSLTDQVQSGKRPALWQAMAEAMWVAPWAGYGWTQTALAQLTQAPLQPPLHVLFTYAHNLWLDLLLWNGMVLGLLAGAAIGGWFWLQLRRVRGSDESLLFLALLGLLVHAQFEFPYAYAYFLLPAGLIAGLLPSGGRDRRLPRGVMLSIVAVLSTVTFVLGYEYVKAEAAWQRVRMEAARIRLPPAEDGGRLKWLDQLQGLIDQSRKNPKSSMTSAEQAAFRAAVERFPGSGALYRLALMEAYQGRPAEAAKALDMLCSLNTPANCTSALNAWRIEAATNPAMLLVQPTNPGLSSSRP